MDDFETKINAALEAFFAWDEARLAIYRELGRGFSHLLDWRGIVWGVAKDDRGGVRLVSDGQPFGHCSLVGNATDTLIVRGSLAVAWEWDPEEGDTLYVLTANVRDDAQAQRWYDAARAEWGDESAIPPTKGGA